METITKYLHDPGWWFSAFFVAILASVIAGFLKEYLESWIGKVFSGLKTWRDEREARRKEIIEAILKDHTYFIIALVRAVLALTMFTMATLLYLTAPIQLTSQPLSPNSAIHTYRAFLVWNIMVPVLGIFNILVGYKAARRISIIGDAIRSYRKLNGLPKLF